MYYVDDMVKKAYEELKNNEKCKDYTDAKIEYKARLQVYNYLRYKVAYKTRIMSFEQYCDYMRLESSILFSDLKYRGNRALKNGYDHLYNELQPFIKGLPTAKRNHICMMCVDFSQDIKNFETLKEYLEYEPIKTYVRFIANRYRDIIIQYDLKNDYEQYCNEILNIVGRNKASSKR